MLIKVAPDTTYGLGVVSVRFVVEEGIPISMIPVISYPTVKKAIEQFERMGDGKGHHYRFRDDIPIRYEYSPLQGDPYDIHTNDYVDINKRISQGYIDCVAYVTFEQPLIIPEDVPLLDEKDGVIPESALPEFLKEEAPTDDDDN